MATSWNNSAKRSPAVRDFNRRRYGNPLFPAGGATHRGGSTGGRSGRRPSNGSGSRAPFSLGKILLTFAALAIAGGAWYAFWGPAFRITEMQVEGASPATEDTVRAALDEYSSGRAALIFPRNNVLFFNEEGAKTAIEHAVYLDGADIRKKLPGTVTVTVREKPIKAVFLREGRLYGLDESGFTVRVLSGEEIALMGDLPPELNSVEVQDLGTESMDVPTDLKAPDPATVAADAQEALKESKNAWPLLIDKRGAELRKDVRLPGTQAFSASTVGIVMQANGRLPDVTGEAVRWFIPDEPADSIDALMAGDWHVYLSTSAPFDLQADRLSLVLKEKIGDRRPKLEYVDLRYNERIFFRMKDAPGEAPAVTTPTPKPAPAPAPVTTVPPAAAAQPASGQPSSNH